MLYVVVYSGLITLMIASQGSGLSIKVTLLEYHPNDALTANTDDYKNYIKSITPDLDLIIFPESTLTLTPSDAVELTVSEKPCHDDSYPSFIRNISCTISDYNRYAVINLIQKLKCTSNDKSPNCKTYGSLLYNTDIVFDRTGTIIALYHKYDARKPFDRPPVPEEVIIETDFGLNLGIFTGSEILFKRPAEDLVAKRVDAIIYPTQWHAELPFLTAFQTQQMWSHTHNVTLFAAGANNPQVGSGGSGVFNGAEGSVVTHINSIGSSTILSYLGRLVGKKLSDNKTDIEADDMDNFHLNIDPNITDYASKILDTTEQNFNGQVCHDGGGENRLCCNFTIKITTSNDSTDEDVYIYHMVAFSGVRPFEDVHYIGVEFCAIIACLNSSVSSCGRRFPSYENIGWPLTFEEITIKANFESSENRTQFPNSLLSSIRPVPVSQTRWEKEEIEVDGTETIIRRTFSLTKPQDRLLSFAIYGRNFCQDYDKNSVQSIDMNLSLLIYSSVAVILQSYFCIYSNCNRKLVVSFC